MSKQWIVLFWDNPFFCIFVNLPLVIKMPAPTFALRDCFSWQKGS